MLYSCQDNSTCCVLDPQLFHLFRASLQSSPLSCISKLFPTWIFYWKYIQVSSSPKALICSWKQRRFTANSFERVVYTHCFLVLTIHSCEPLQSGLCPYHPEKLHASKSPDHEVHGSYSPEPLYSIWHFDLPLFRKFSLGCYRIVYCITMIFKSPSNCSF